MSRDIDFSKPLSEEDAQYAADRPWLIEDARLKGILPVGEGEFVVADDEDDEDDSAADAADEADDEQDESEEESDEDDEDASEDDEEAPYDEWDYQSLKDEAKRRDLSAAGSKEQLINRLLENDGE